MTRQPIHKDNYEEYFLLYVDNELTPAEKAEVERFVEQHPELKQELQAFLATRLEPEQLRMEGLEEMFRTEETGIHAGNYEEFQLLMIDGELDEKNGQRLEEYNRDHPEAAANFEWLKKARLEPEEIPFLQKDLLYKKTSKPATLISIRWFRYAAAAAVFFLAGLAWLNQEEEGIVPQGPIAQQLPKDGKAQRPAPAPDAQAENGGATGESQSSSGTVDSIGSSEENGIVAPVSSSGTSKDGSNPVPARKENPNLRQEARDNKSVELRPGEDVNQSSEITRIDMGSITDPEREMLEEKVNMTVPDNIAYITAARQTSTLNVKTDYATQALLGGDEEEAEEIDTNDNNQRKGLRGFVRKATRIYNKVTNPDLDKPLAKAAKFETGTPR